VAKSARADNARLKQLRAQQQAQERRRRLLIAIGAVVAVAIVVAVLVVVSVLAPKKTSGGSAALDTAVAKTLTGIPASVFDTVGVGAGASNPPKPISAPPLTADGKPRVLYVGAEYCPYCAAERWAMAVALSKFGTFTGLRGIHSSSSDAFPSTPTLTFYKTGYQSKYLVFTPVETTTEDRNTPLQKTTAAQEALLSKYDAPPYVSQGSTGAIPFIDFGNKYLVSGASYSPEVLQGKTWSEVAAALSNPADPVSQGAVGAANKMTAAICKLTNNQPASACTPAIQKLEGQF
jgi:hypothetical protein